MRIAALTDIHEDFRNLLTAFRKIDKLSCDYIACLGDISGFSVPYYNYFDERDANACLDLVRGNCAVAVAGNHDLFACRKIPENHSVFRYPPDWYSLDFRERQKLGMNLLWLYEDDELSPLYSIENIRFLRTLPETHIVENKDIRVFLSHYLYPDVSGSMREFHQQESDFHKHFAYFTGQNCAISLVGHSHPTGIEIVRPGEYTHKRFFPFRSRQPVTGPACIIVPAITRNSFFSGFIIFDTEQMMVEYYRI